MTIFSGSVFTTKQCRFGFAFFLHKTSFPSWVLHIVPNLARLILVQSSYLPVLGQSQCNANVYIDYNCDHHTLPKTGTQMFKEWHWTAFKIFAIRRGRIQIESKTDMEGNGASYNNYKYCFKFGKFSSFVYIGSR